MQETHEVSPSDKIEELVSLFLYEAARTGEADPSDVFGVKPLMFLIKALRIIEASEAQWDRVAGYLLEKPKGLAIYYRPIFSELVPHISADMVERIRERFVSSGELSALMNLLRLRAWRNLSADEILGIAAYHRKQRTSSDAFVWRELLRLSVGTDAESIEALRLEVQIEEDSDNICF